jgi:hypothetical protein
LPRCCSPWLDSVRRVGLHRPLVSRGVTVIANSPIATACRQKNCNRAGKLDDDAYQFEFVATTQCGCGTLWRWTTDGETGGPYPHPRLAGWPLRHGDGASIAAAGARGTCSCFPVKREAGRQRPSAPRPTCAAPATVKRTGCPAGTTQPVLPATGVSCSGKVARVDPPARIPASKGARSQASRRDARRCGEAAACACVTPVMFFASPSRHPSCRISAGGGGLPRSGRPGRTPVARLSCHA